MGSNDAMATLARRKLLICTGLQLPVIPKSNQLLNPDFMFCRRRRNGFKASLEESLTARKCASIVGNASRLGGKLSWNQGSPPGAS
jgi:hypothetical protein